MATLKLMDTDAINHLVQPEEFNDVDLDSSALTISTDFKNYHPSIIESSTPAVEAELLMQKSHLQLALVVDSAGEFVGTIDIQKLNDQSLMPFISKGSARDEILVSELMVPRAQVKALEFQALAHASIADIIAVLRKQGEQQCLVVDVEKHQIRGLISTGDISRRLHMPIEITRPATFSEIFRVVKP